MTHVHRLVLAVFAVLALGGARSQAARSRGEVCVYTPEMAEALFLAFPKADVDGDGELSREEACDLQAELRRITPSPETRSPETDAEIETLLSEPLCCNCGDVETTSTLETPTCQKVEGTDR